MDEHATRHYALPLKLGVAPRRSNKSPRRSPYSGHLVAGAGPPARTGIRGRAHRPGIPLQTEPVESDMVLQHIGTAVPVHVNFAINNMDRVASELRTALQRHHKEVELVRQELQRALRNELKGTVAALLLSCELALQVPVSQAKPKARCAASTSLPRKCVSSSKVPEAQRRSSVALLYPIPKRNILRTCTLPQKILPRHRSSRTTMTQQQETWSRRSLAALPASPGEIRARTGYRRYLEWHMDLHP